MSCSFAVLSHIQSKEKQNENQLFKDVTEMVLQINTVTLPFAVHYRQYSCFKTDLVQFIRFMFELRNF